MAGRPIAESSATVDAPERDTTKCEAAMRAGNTRFSLNLSDQDKADLIAFLQTL